MFAATTKVGGHREHGPMYILSQRDLGLGGEPLDIAVTTQHSVIIVAATTNVGRRRQHGPMYIHYTRPRATTLFHRGIILLPLTSQ